MHTAIILNRGICQTRQSAYWHVQRMAATQPVHAAGGLQVRVESDPEEWPAEAQRLNLYDKQHAAAWAERVRAFPFKILRRPSCSRRVTGYWNVLMQVSALLQAQLLAVVSLPARASLLFSSARGQHRHMHGGALVLTSHMSCI